MNQQWFDKQFEELERSAPRRREALEKMLAGETDKAIASSMHVADTTVRKHIQQACKHFKIKAVPGEHIRRRELVALFRKYKPELVKIKDVCVEEDKTDELVEEAQEEEILAAPPKQTSSDGMNTQRTTNPASINDTVQFSNLKQNNDNNLFQLTVSKSRMLVDTSHQNEKPIVIPQNAIEKRLNDKANGGGNKLFGIDEKMNVITEYLQDVDDNFLISITGAGGFGKTSLAVELIRKRAASLGFIDLAWSTAKKIYWDWSSCRGDLKQSSVDTNFIIRELIGQIGNIPPSQEDLLPAFKKKLNQAPYLIVIDNLETLVDSKKFFDIFNEFHIIRPSKVILTSRHRLKRHIFLREIQLSGINKQATLEMIRKYGDRINRVQQASDEDLLPIYQKTNGNPLLILLVINLLTFYDCPLQETLEMLAKQEKVQEFLYAASLSEMSDNGLKILMAMIKYSPGSVVLRQDIMKVTELNYQEFTEAVAKCLEFNLLNAPENLNVNDEPRYSIHSLLYEFLRKQNYA